MLAALLLRAPHQLPALASISISISMKALSRREHPLSEHMNACMVRYGDGSETQVPVQSSTRNELKSLMSAQRGGVEVGVRM